MKAISTKYIINALLVLFTCLATVACSKDDNDVVASRNCYISSVTLGVMKRRINVVLDNGRDSSYIATYSGGYYTMAIDQLKGTISNSDSLLYNTVLGPALITIKSSGTVIYRPENQIEEEWSAYSSNDSIDLSSPILLRVYSTDGSAMREYRMTFNVRKQDPNGFTWTSKPVSILDGYARMKAVWNGSGLVVMASKEGQVDGYCSNSEGTEWFACQAAVDGQADVTTLTLWQEKLWMSTQDGRLLCGGVDGNGWNEAASVSTVPLRILAAYNDTLYAMGNGQMWKTGNDLQWKADKCDTPDMLPTTDAIATAYSLDHGDGRIVMVGRHNADEHAAVWGKTLSKDSKSQWIYYPEAQGNRHLCPAMENMSLTRYNKDLIAIGDSLTAAYISVDNGVTWKPNYKWVLPTLERQKAAALVADDKGRLWLLCGEKVYCGHAHTLK